MLPLPFEATAVTRDLVFNLLVIVSETCVMLLSMVQRCTVKNACQRCQNHLQRYFQLAVFWNKSWVELEMRQRENRTALSPPQKVSGNHGMLLQASAPGHGGSYSLSKSLEWKRNVTGYFKANGFFHWIEHLPKIVRGTFFSPPNISLCKCLCNNQNSIFSQLREAVLKRRDR